MKQLEVEMKIKIVCVGKVKEKYLTLGIDEYIKRISPYMDVSIVEVSEESISNPKDQSEIDKAIKKEAERLLKAISNDSFVIALDLNKKELDSLQFSSYLYDCLEKGGANLTFVIGGSYGLSEEVKNRVNDSLSLSKLTYLHQMSRLILLEQIYRAIKIKNNEVYHK